MNQNVEYVTIGVNGPPEPEFLSTDRDDGLIHMPLIDRLGPVSANAVGKMSAKAVDPETNRLPAHDNTAFSKKVFHIGRAQSKPMIGPDRVGDNFTQKTKPLQTGESARQSHVVSITETPGSNNLAIPTGGGGAVLADLGKQVLSHYRAFEAQAATTGSAHLEVLRELLRDIPEEK